MSLSPKWFCVLNHAAYWLILILLGIPIPPSTSFAQLSSTYIGSDANWTDPTAWSTNPFYPDNGNAGLDYDVVFDSPSRVILDDDIEIDALDVSLGSGIIHIEGQPSRTLVANDTFTVRNTLRLSGAATLQLNGPGFIVGDDETSLRATPDGYITAEYVVAGTAGVTSSDSMTIRNNFTVNNSSDLSIRRTVGVFEDATFNNLGGASVRVTGEGDIFAGDGGEFVNHSGGTLTYDVPNGTSRAVGVINHGLFQITAGEVDVQDNSGSVHSGSFVVDAGAELQLGNLFIDGPSAGVSGLGTVQFNGSASIGGSYAVGATNVLASPWWDQSAEPGDLTVGSTGVPRFNGPSNTIASLSNSGTVEANGDITITGPAPKPGRITGINTDRTITFQSTVGGPGSFGIFDNIEVVLAPGGVWEGGTATLMNGTHVINQFPARIENTFFFDGGGGGNRLTNLGIIRALAGPMIFGVSLENDNQVHVSGVGSSFQSLGGGEHTGLFNVTDGAHLEFEGAHTFQAGARVMVDESSTIKISDGNYTYFTGDYIVAGVTEISELGTGTVGGQVTVMHAAIMQNPGQTYIVGRGATVTVAPGQDFNDLTIDGELNVTGSSTVNGTLIHRGGTIGGVGGTLTANGPADMTGAGTRRIEDATVVLAGSDALFEGVTSIAGDAELVNNTTNGVTVVGDTIITGPFWNNTTVTVPAAADLRIPTLLGAGSMNVFGTFTVDNVDPAIQITAKSGGTVHFFNDQPCCPLTQVNASTLNADAGGTILIGGPSSGPIDVTLSGPRSLDPDSILRAIGLAGTPETLARLDGVVDGDGFGDVEVHDASMVIGVAGLAAGPDGQEVDVISGDFDLIRGAFTIDKNSGPTLAGVDWLIDGNLDVEESTLAVTPALSAEAEVRLISTGTTTYRQNNTVIGLKLEHSGTSASNGSSNSALSGEMATVTVDPFAQLNLLEGAQLATAPDTTTILGSGSIITSSDGTGHFNNYGVTDVLLDEIIFNFVGLSALVTNSGTLNVVGTPPPSGDPIFGSIAQITNGYEQNSTLTVADATVHLAGPVDFSNGQAVLTDGKINYYAGSVPDLVFGFDPDDPPPDHSIRGTGRIVGNSLGQFIAFNPAGQLFIDGLIAPGDAAVADPPSGSPVVLTSIAVNAQPGTLMLEANDVTVGPNAEFVVELAGTNPDTDHDQVVITNSVMLGGTLTAKLDDSYVPDHGDEFVVITYALAAGAFDLYNEPTIDPLPAIPMTIAPIRRATDFLLAAVIPGDFNRDGMVSIGDLSILAGNFGSELGIGSYELGDANHDGRISIGDLSILASNFGLTDTTIGDDFTSTGISLEAAMSIAGIDPSSVPEPHGLGVLVVGGALLMRRRSVAPCCVLAPIRNFH